MAEGTVIKMLSDKCLSVQVVSLRAEGQHRWKQLLGRGWWPRHSQVSGGAGDGGASSRGKERSCWEKWADRKCSFFSRLLWWHSAKSQGWGAGEPGAKEQCVCSRSCKWFPAPQTWWPKLNGIGDEGRSKSGMRRQQGGNREEAEGAGGGGGRGAFICSSQRAGQIRSCKQMGSLPLCPNHAC